MAKKAATFRLEEESLAWVASAAERMSGYEGRKVAQAEVVEIALASFRGDCEGGVPDVPSTVTEVVESERAAARVDRALSASKPTPVKGQVKPTSLTGAQVAGQIVRASSLVGPSALALERQRRLNVSADRARKDGK
jgi:hypothetical protein